MVVVSHFMSIMKKKKKKKKRRRKKEEEEEEEEESLRTVFCSIVRSDFESVCGKNVDLGQIYNLRTSWDDTCAQAAPSLAKHTRQFLFLDHITSLTSVNR